MPATYTDRIDGLATSVAVKAPCRVATTANITLSGLQTIDGVTVVAGDRILAKDQTSAIDNGIWVAASGAWSRARDFDGGRDAVPGTQVWVLAGNANSDSYWHVDGSDSTPVAIGTDNIAFVAAFINGSASLVNLEYDAPDSIALNLRQYVEDDGAYNLMGFIPQALKAAIRDFSSTTDISAYLQLAHDNLKAAGSGGAVRLPKGRFVIEQDVRADQFHINMSNFTLEGVGPATQIYKPNSGTVADNQSLIMVAPSAANVENVVLRNFRITGPTAATGGTIAGTTNVCGIQFQDALTNYIVRDCLVENVIIEKMETAGFVLTSGLTSAGYCDGIRFVNCTAKNLRQDGFNDYGGGYNRNIVFALCNAIDCDGFGHEHSTAQGLQIIGGNVIRCGQGGIGVEYNNTYSPNGETHIIGVTLKDIYSTGYPDAPAISLGQSQNPLNTFIRGNLINRVGGHGIVGNLVPSNIGVEDNVILNVGKGGVDMGGIFGFNGTDIVVRKNIVKTSLAGYTLDQGIVIQGSSATNRISGNEVNAVSLNIGGGALNRYERNLHPYKSTTTTGNIGGGEDDLISYTIPAKTLEQDGQQVKLRLAGTTAANANNKTLKIYWNGTAVLDTGAVAANAKPWVFEVIVTRLTSTSAAVFVSGQFNGATVAATKSTVATTFSGAVIVKCTGTSGSSATDDITQDLMLLEYIDA